MPGTFTFYFIVTCHEVYVYLHLRSQDPPRIHPRSCVVLYSFPNYYQRYLGDSFVNRKICQESFIFRSRVPINILSNELFRDINALEFLIQTSLICELIIFYLYCYIGSIHKNDKISIFKELLDFILIVLIISFVNCKIQHIENKYRITKIFTSFNISHPAPKYKIV